MKKYVDELKLYFAVCWELRIIIGVMVGVLAILMIVVKFITPGGYPGFDTNRNPFDWNLYPVTQVKMVCRYDNQSVEFKRIIKIDSTNETVYTLSGKYPFELSYCSFHSTSETPVHGS